MSRSVSPGVYFLWDGVPFDLLGLHEKVITASFGVVTGKAESKFARGGVPKVGAAELTIALDNRLVASQVAHLLLQKQRPVISVAAGLHPQDMKWLGAWKLDKVSWSYGAEAVNTVSLSGLTDKVMQMAETKKPRVFVNQKVRDIFRILADAHNIVIDTTGLSEAALDARIDSLSSSHESDWDFITRLGEDVGAAAIYFDQPQDVVDVHVADQLTRGVISNKAMSHQEAHRQLGTHFARAVAQATARKVLRLSSAPGWYDIGRHSRERRRELVIAYKPHAYDVKADIVVQQLSIDVEGFRSAPVPTGAKNGADKTESARSVVTDWDKKTGRFTEVVETNINAALPGDKTQEKAEAAQEVARQRDDAVKYYRIPVSMPPEEAMRQIPPAHKLRAMALARGFNMTLNFTLNPGEPLLMPPWPFQLVGTDAHNGKWSVESTTLNWSESGLITTHMAKPWKAPADPNKKKTPAADTPDARFVGTDFSRKTQTFSLIDEVEINAPLPAESGLGPSNGAQPDPPPAADVPVSVSPSSSIPAAAYAPVQSASSEALQFAVSE